MSSFPDAVRTFPANGAPKYRAPVPLGETTSRFASAGGSTDRNSIPLNVVGFPRATSTVETSFIELADTTFVVRRNSDSLSKNRIVGVNGGGGGGGGDS